MASCTVTVRPSASMPHAEAGSSWPVVRSWACHQRETSQPVSGRTWSANQEASRSMLTGPSAVAATRSDMRKIRVASSGWASAQALSPRPTK